MTLNEYNQCVSQHADGLYRFILKNIKNPEEADDIVQDTFEKLWKKVDDVPLTNAKSYLFTTGYRTMIDHIRKLKPMVDADDMAFEPAVGPGPSPDLKEILQKALETLPPVQRSVLMLRDYEGYSYQEIGEITNLNESQVKVYIFRARAAMKQYLVSIDYVV